MELTQIFFKMGLVGIGSGVGLSIVRDITPKALKFVAVASFFCCGINAILYEITTNYFISAFVSRFIATSFIKIMCIKGKCSVYFPIIITSVYCICPGTVIGAMFHHTFCYDLDLALPFLSRGVLVCLGIATGVLLSDNIIKSDNYKIYE